MKRNLDTTTWDLVMSLEKRGVEGLKVWLMSFGISAGVPLIVLALVRG